MKKISFLLVLVIAGCLSIPALAQKTDRVADAVKQFPYERNGDAALNLMRSWEKGDWKKFFKYFEDDSLKVKASYALSAYVNAVAGEPERKTVLVAMLNKQVVSTKSEYIRLLVQSQLNLLTDKAVVDQSLTVLPKLPDAPIAQVVNSNGTQLLLSLQDQLQAATNPIQKRNILSQAARVPGFYSFAFVSQSLNDKDVNRQAAQILARLALQDESIKGVVAHQVLEAALPLIKGEDSTVLATKLIERLRKMPYDYGFVNLFNGKDINGWRGLVQNPVARAKMKPEVLAKEQLAADEKAKNDWVVRDGLLVFTGHGENLVTERQYGDFEMFIDWKITDKGDAGIYLRGTPQVQIWDISRTEVGAQVGSGGLYNNQKNQSKPLVVADNKVGEWNNFHIIMKADKVSVWLNGILVTDNITLENYWDKNLPIFPKEQIELQAHGTYVAYRNIYVRELAPSEPYQLTEADKKLGYKLLFDGTNLDQWTGNKSGYSVTDGVVEVNPDAHGGGNLYTVEEFANFEFRFEFQLTPGANNGIGIRAPLEGDAAYVGMEIQVLDSEHPKWATLQPYQYHGSVYGVFPAKRGYLLPAGQWNKEEIQMKGSKIKVTLNGTVIVDTDLKDSIKNGAADHRPHPGLARTTGHIGFLGHGDVVRFKNMRVKKL